MSAFVREPVPWMDQPHFLYRLFDADGVLLYLGCSVNPEKRVLAHRSREWYPRVARMTTEGPFPGRKAGHAAEDKAIDDERPLFALNSRQVGQRGAASTHAIGPDGLTSLTRARAGRKQFGQPPEERERIRAETRARVRQVIDSYALCLDDPEYVVACADDVLAELYGWPVTYQTAPPSESGGAA